MTDGDRMTTPPSPVPVSSPGTGLTTHDTPEAALAAALMTLDTYRPLVPGDTIGNQKVADRHAAAILAAMPGWTLVPKEGVTMVTTDLWNATVEMASELPERMEARAETTRLRAALEIIAAKPEPGNGTAIYVSPQSIARAALAPSEP